MVSFFDFTIGERFFFFGLLSFCKENKYNIWDTISRKWNDEEFKSNYVAFSYDKNFDIICYSKKDDTIWLFDKDNKTFDFLANNIVEFIKTFFSTIDIYDLQAEPLPLGR